MAPPAQIHTSTLSLPPDSYIYKLLPTSARTSPLSYSTLDELAVICSDDSLRFLTPSLTLASSGLIKNVHESVTCLERVDDRGTIVATAGRDSTVRFWDRRTRSRVSEIRTRMFYDWLFLRWEWLIGGQQRRDLYPRLCATKVGIW